MSKQKTKFSGSPIITKVGPIGMNNDEILINKKLLLKIDHNRGVGQKF